MESASDEHECPLLSGDSTKNTDVMIDQFDFDYPPIECSFEGPVIKQSIAEQYFESRFCKVDDESYCVLFHSNRICIVTLSKMHSIIKEGKKVTKVDFKQTTGFQKKNMLQPNTIVCAIQCADESQYKVRAMVSGKLIEINENLVNDPSLLEREPAEDGYLFIILPSIVNYENFKKKYPSVDEGKS